MDEWAATPLAQDFRTIMDDLHHGLRQRGLEGEADALAHVLRKAEEAGVPEPERQRMATEQFQRLLNSGAKRKRFAWWRERRDEAASELQGRQSVKQLPPPS